MVCVVVVGVEIGFEHLQRAMSLHVRLLDQEVHVRLVIPYRRWQCVMRRKVDASDKESEESRSWTRWQATWRLQGSSSFLETRDNNFLGRI